MLKVIGFVSAAALALPFLASAATFSNVQFNNGDVTVSGQGGSTVNATFHVIVPANQVVENIETDVIGDNLAPVCQSVGGDLGLQEGTHDVTVSVKLPPNTGTYTLNVRGAGIYGGIRSIDCNDNVVGTGSFPGALRTVSTDVTTTGSSSSSLDSLAALVANLTKAVGCVTTGGTWDGATCTPKAVPPAPVVSAACQAYAQAKSGTVMGMKNDANVRFQGFLLSQGMSIPALAAGASFGFFGPQTSAADISFQAMNHCQ